MRWPAEFGDGQTPVMHAALVQLEAGVLQIDASDDGRRLASWPLAAVALDELSEGVAHAHCTEQPHAMLSFAEPALAAALRERVGQRSAKHEPGSRTSHALLYLLLIALFAGGIYLAIPGFSRAVAHQIPLEYERELGAGMLLLISRDYCSDVRADEVLAALERRLDPRDAVQAELHVMRSPVVNAFALPGGVVVLTEGLLDEARGPDEIAGVLAHELEHVRQRHVMTHFVRASLLAAGWSVAVGDYAGLMVIDPGTAFQIANLRFSRDEEAAADEGAARALDAAGISRRGLYDFFERLSDKTDFMPQWLASHPSSASRARALDDGERAERSTSPALEAGELEILRAACNP